MSEVVQQNVDCSCFDWRNDGLQKAAMIYYCMYICTIIIIISVRALAQGQISYPFQKAERLKSMDKKTLLAFLNRNGYKNKHGPGVYKYMCVQYQNHDVCT